MNPAQGRWQQKMPPCLGKGEVKKNQSHKKTPNPQTKPNPKLPNQNLKAKLQANEKTPKPQFLTVISLGRLVS